MASISVNQPGTSSSLALAVAVLTALAAPAAQAVNALTDPSFENNPLSTLSAVIGGASMVPNVWGPENATIVNAAPGVAGPSNLTKMLAIAPFSGVTTQVVQAINIGAQPPGSTFTLSADFNARFPGAIGGLAMQFFTGSSYSSQIPLSYVGSNINVDGNPDFWQTHSFSGSIPAGTTWVLAQAYYLTSSLGGQTGYLDNANLTVAVPEPASMAMLALGVLVIGLRQRQRARRDS